jgi:CRISPR-associated endonuclease/helicase Cas3
MDALTKFREEFRALTGNEPFPWQEDLHQRFRRGEIPSICTLPTGVGKISVVTLWLLALAHGAKLPRRLVYVVNRRTVVDQTTAEVERICENLKLKLPAIDMPGVSTLRGQFADNRDWSADPSRPAVICGYRGHDRFAIAVFGLPDRVQVKTTPCRVPRSGCIACSRRGAS